MKSILKNIHHYLLGIALAVSAAGCSDDNTSDLRLDGDAWLTALELDGQYSAIIDNTTKSVTVAVPEIFDESAMTVTNIEVSEGATANVKKGDVLNLTYPQVITIINGNAYLDYTVKVKHDEARITGFKLNDKYTGIINQEDHTISVRIPSSLSLTGLIPTITTSDGATVTPASGLPVDFTSPVEFTATYNTATTVYTVTVTQNDAPTAVYVGLASSIDQQNIEERTAAEWMLANVPNADYVSFNDVLAGTVDLSECEIMWWHLHIDGGIDTMDKFDNAAPDALNALVKIKDLYNNGMSLLLTRYGTYYAAKVGATLDGANPNNCWGGSEAYPEITGGAWSFFTNGKGDHPVYKDLVMGDDANAIFTCDTGYGITNTTAQWHIGTDWGDYADYDTWRNNHGGVDLGYGGDGAIVVWEYPAADGHGGIFCIGSGCYDWYAEGVDVSNDKYHVNVAKMTENAIKYLTGK